MKKYFSLIMYLIFLSVFSCGSISDNLLSITITPVTKSIEVEGTQKFTATGVYLNETKDLSNNVTWSVSDSTVASISSSGLVTGLQEGSTEITAKIGNFEATADLSVTAVDDDAPVITTDIYLSGAYNETAVYWENGVMQELTLPEGAGESYAKSIFINGEDIHIVGNYNADLLYHAIYWKNDEEPLLLTCDNVALARGLYVIGTDVYIVGECYDSDSDTYTPLYWENGVANPLAVPGDAVNTYTSALFVVENDVHVVGEYSDGVYTKAVYWLNDDPPTALENEELYSTYVESMYIYENEVHVVGFRETAEGDLATYWKDGVIQTLNLLAGAGDSYANSIFVDASGVYITGEYSDGGFSKAVSWKDGDVVELEIPEDAIESYTNSIFVEGTDVYIAGDYYNIDKDMALYWKNGELQELVIPEDSEESSLNSIFVVSN